MDKLDYIVKTLNSTVTRLEYKTGLVIHFNFYLDKPKKKNKRLSKKQK